MSESYFEKQKEWKEINNLQLGDSVRVVRSAVTGEQGWTGSWDDKMDRMVGGKFEVGGEGPKGFLPGGDDFTLCWFPYFVLEKIDSKLQKVEPKEWTVSYGMKVRTGDPVLVRDNDDDQWGYSFFSHESRRPGNSYRYCTVGDPYKFCIPYAGNEHLVGTTDDWESQSTATEKDFRFGAKVKFVLDGDEQEGVLINFDSVDKNYEITYWDGVHNMPVSVWVWEFTYID